MLPNKKIFHLFLFLPTLLTGIESFSQQTKSQNKPDEYRAVLWTSQDGLLSEGTNFMIKDSKGFLWIGASGVELSRFDGAKFKRYNPDPNKRGSINSIGISSFVEDSLNNIWMGSKIGLSRYDMKADTFSNFARKVDSIVGDMPIIPFWATNSHVYCFEPRLGITSYDIYSFKRDLLLNLPDKTEKNTPGLHYIILDTVSNSIWMLEGLSQDPDRGGLLQISLADGKRQHFEWPCSRNNITHRHSAEAMQFDRKRNSIWINTGDGLIEFTLADKKFHHKEAFKEYIKLKSYERWVGIEIDKDGKIWLATHIGILIYDPKTDQVDKPFSDPDLQRKVSDANMHIYCDRDGIGWTSNWMAYGLYEILPVKRSVKRYPPKPGVQNSLSNGFIGTIIPGPQGKLWMGTHDGINIFDPLTERFEVIREKDLPGIKGTTIIPAYIDTLRRKAWLYAGSFVATKIYKMELFEMDMNTKQCRQIIFRNGTKQIESPVIEPSLIKPYKNGLLITADFYGFFEIKEGSLFADLATHVSIKEMISSSMIEEGRLAFLKAYNALPNYNFKNENGKWIRISHRLDSIDWFCMIYNDKDQTHWVSSKYKLVQYDKDFRELKIYGEEDGYAGLALNMIIDDAGNLWFFNTLEQVGRLNIATGIIALLSETDGYNKKDFDWTVPLAKDAGGNLHFGTGFYKGNKGLDRIYPEKFVSGSTSSVYYRSLTISQKSLPLSIGVNNLEELSLLYNQNTISIETGIIDFYTKGKSKLRYKLVRDGKDEDWQYGDAYNIIRYDGLVPGKYRLIMQSSNVNNEFNSPEKILTIHISPPFWQTWWFRILAVITLLLLFYGIYRWRTAALRKQKRILEQTVKERTAELVEEKAEVERQKEKSEELLLNILPSEVADELKEKGYTTARSFDEVTVLFSDIKGFTNVAEKLTAQELVKEIDTYFSAFDNIILKYGLEKIKTIGDAYIAAGGLPEKNSATAQNVIEAAIAMQQEIGKLKHEREITGKPYFELRIGIHTGHVVAGVVGIKKFQYDIWGDTVNLAARMEQSGVPGKINISQQTYELVKDQFNCIHRGKVEAKNKGEIDMYFVE